MTFPANHSINGSRFPYERCLIPNLPEDVQHQMRAITNFFVVPFDMLLAVLSFIANSLVLTAIARTRALQTPAQLMLCSLSVTDLLYAVLSFIWNLLKVTAQHMCPKPVTEHTCLTVATYMATFGNLAIISRDRYLAVSRTWWYRTHVTPTLVMKKTMAVWLYSVVLALVLYIIIVLQLSLIMYSILMIMSAIFYIICISVILSSYIGIFVASRRHKRSMPQEGDHVRSMLTREKKMATTVGLILLVLLFTFLPALISPIVIVLLNLAGKTDEGDYFNYGPFYQVLITLNGLLNPLLNYGRNQDVRKAVRKMIGCHPRNRQIVPSAVSQRTRDTNEEITQQNPAGTMDT